MQRDPTPVNIRCVPVSEAREVFGSYWFVDNSTDPYPSIREHLGPVNGFHEDVAVTDLDQAKENIAARVKGRLQKRLSRRESSLNHWKSKLTVRRLQSKVWPIKRKDKREAIQKYLDDTESLRKEIEGFSREWVQCEPLPSSLILRPYLAIGTEIFVVQEPSIKNDRLLPYEVERYRISDVRLYDHRSVSMCSAKNEYLDFLVHYCAEPVGDSNKPDIHFDLDRVTDDSLDEIRTQMLGQLCFYAEYMAKAYARLKLELLKFEVDQSLQRL